MWRAIALSAVLFCGLTAGAQSIKEINLFFYGARPKLTHKQVTRLDSLLGTIDRSQITHVIIVGHTDSIFGRASHSSLAEKRALDVKDLLVERSVPGSRIRIIPPSAPVPVMEGLVPTGRSRNRRVYLRVECAPHPAPIVVPSQ